MSDNESQYSCNSVILCGKGDLFPPWSVARRYSLYKTICKYTRIVQEILRLSLNPSSSGIVCHCRLDARSASPITSAAIEIAVCRLKYSSIHLL